MPECFRQPTYDLEPKPLPQRDGTRVGAHDEIELYGDVSGGCRILQSMRAHGAGDSAPLGRCRGHERTVRHMVAATQLIGADVIASDQYAVIGNKYGVARRAPVGECFCPGPVGRERVGFTGPDDGRDNLLDRLVIAGNCASDNHAGPAHIHLMSLPGSATWALSSATITPRRLPLVQRNGICWAFTSPRLRREVGMSASFTLIPGEGTCPQALTRRSEFGERPLTPTL